METRAKKKGLSFVPVGDLSAKAKFKLTETNRLRDERTRKTLEDYRRSIETSK